MNFLSNVLREDGGFEYKKVGRGLDTSREHTTILTRAARGAGFL